MPAERLARCGGFTFIELAVVLAVLGLMLALTAPFIAGHGPAAALPAAVMELRAALQGARSAAVAQDRSIAFRGDPRGGYWLDRQYYPLSTAAYSRDSVRVAVAGASHVLFFPSGGSSGGTIRVDAGGGYRDIAIDAITGRVVPQP